MSHSEIVERKRAEFIEKLFKEPPQGCGLQVGDEVSFTNEFDVTFDGLKVVGFSGPDEHGRCVHLDDAPYWFPIDPEDISLTHRPQVAPTTKPLQGPKI